MRKNEIIEDQKRELESRNRDIWHLTYEIAALHDETKVLEAAGVEAERDLLEAAKTIQSLNGILGTAPTR